MKRMQERKGWDKTNHEDKQCDEQLPGDHFESHQSWPPGHVCVSLTLLAVCASDSVPCPTHLPCMARNACKKNPDQGPKHLGR